MRVTTAPRRQWLRVALMALLLGPTLLLAQSPSPQATPIKVGVLQYGTVNWTLTALQQLGLDQSEAFSLEVIPYATVNATTLALQGRAVDVIVTDWLWVSRQRDQERLYRFYPYSQAVGELIVPASSGAQNLLDLANQPLGIAGGPLDKSWLLLRAYSRQTFGQDIADSVAPRFVAPPLLNQLIQRGQVAAALNYWHYSARLKAQGMRPLLTVEEILAALGVEGELPLLGWTFNEAWAETHRPQLNAFLAAVVKTQERLRSDDELWQTLRPLMKVDDDETFQALKASFRAGVPQQSRQQHLANAREIFKLLATLGGERLVGDSQRLNPDTFWLESP